MAVPEHQVPKLMMQFLSGPPACSLFYSAKFVSCECGLSSSFLPSFSLYGEKRALPLVILFTKCVIFWAFPLKTADLRGGEIASGSWESDRLWNHITFLNLNFMYLLCVCASMCAHGHTHVCMPCHSVLVETRGHLCEVGSHLLPLSGVWGLNWGPRTRMASDCICWIILVVPS